MEDYFTYETRKKYLKCFEWITTHTYEKNIRTHAAGRLGVYTMCALATENPDMLKQILSSQKAKDIMKALKGDNNEP